MRFVLGHPARPEASHLLRETIIRNAFNIAERVS
jgi:hypothetical protein